MQGARQYDKRLSMNGYWIDEQIGRHQARSKSTPFRGMGWIF